MSQSQPELRIGDSDREAAVSSLGEHYAAGRLTKDEFDERSDQAWSAKTASQLWPLFADLPRPQAAGGSTRAPQAVRPQPRAGRNGHPGWRFGGALAPVLAVVAVLVVLTNLPVFLLVFLIWVLLARTNHAWSANRRYHRQHGQFR